jgi:hypothetical protein
MANIQIFEDTSGKPIAVNPSYVRLARPHGPHTEKTVLTFSDGKTYTVMGTLSDVVNQLNT